MRCFGRHPDCVGVNGIETCMGIFLATDAQLFAFHITSGTDDADKNGIDAFVEYIKATEPTFDRTTARLYGVVNANLRTNDGELLNRCAMGLGVGRAQLVTLTDLPRKQGGGRHAAAVICRRVGAEIELSYKLNDDVTWTEGAGVARDGYHLHALEPDRRFGTDIDETWITVGSWWGWVSSCTLF